MRPARILGSVVVVVACVALTGCKPSNNKGQLEGTKWTSVSQPIQGREEPEGYLTIEFTSDKRFVYQVGPSELKGRYTIDSGDRVTMFYDTAVAGKTKHIKSVRVRGTELEISDAEGNMRKFHKVS